MKRSLLMLALLLSLGGCNDDDGKKGGSIAVTWTTQTANAEGTGVAVACPAGATTAVVFALAEGETQPYEETAPCADGALEIGDLPEGSYTVWVRLTDSTMTTRYAESFSRSETVTVGSTSTPEDYPIFVDHGFFMVSWNLQAPEGAGPVACSEVPGTSRIAITVTDGSAALFDTVVDCEEGIDPLRAITRPLPSGVGDSPAYTVIVQLIDEEGFAIGSSLAISSAEAGPIDYGNKYQDLGVVDIYLD